MTIYGAVFDDLPPVDPSAWEDEPAESINTDDKRFLDNLPQTIFLANARVMAGAEPFSIRVGPRGPLPNVAIRIASVTGWVFGLQFNDPS